MEELKKHELYIDEIYKLRVCDPYIGNQKIELRQECIEYSKILDSFKAVSYSLFKITKTIAKDVNEEKIRGIGTQNQLKTISAQSRNEHQMHQCLIFEVNSELQRLRREHQLLQNIETEQMEIISNFIVNQ
ncbi:uncharacterized protein Dana_GF19927 [Drosophila ananassae]|uniref:Intraflagellar transport protein 20 homolog n=1 Tax=Drosophila ananassae TaxID=7217 RepID=B3M2Q0_DROAN|nr:intraflagellar transport protein 20 homolog [Drosophila ananassae]EDV42371.1 uncharacterized protein Dana_GF19927 [Drosophila ananassae]KAH8331100.1 hypothetical protein KR067_011567 [Drosophila pandora]